MKGWIIFGLAIVLYFVSIFGGFVQDDLHVIEGDREMGKVESLIKVWTRPYYYQEDEKSVFRPVTSFSFYINALVTGRGAWGFRLVNVLLYVWACWLVYEVLNKLENSENKKIESDRYDAGRLPQPAKTGLAMTIWGNMYDQSGWWRDWAFWGAMVFVVLPIHTEVVNNIVGRAEILSLGFLLLAILQNLKKKWDLSALFLLLAMMSKETAVVGLPILIYLIIVDGGRFDNTRNDKKINGEIVEEKVAAITMVSMAVVAFVLVRTMILGGVGVENRATVVENPLKFVSSEKRIMNGIALIPLGLEKILFPINLSYDYSYNQIKMVDNWTDWRVVVGMLIIIFSSIYLMDSCLRRNDKKNCVFVIVGMMMFWGPILITSNILFPIGTIFGERLWFLPSLGVVMIAMLIGSKTAKNRTPALLFRPADKRDSLRLSRTWSVRLFGYSSAPILITLLFLFSGRTFVRNLDWLSQERLFIHDGEVATKSVMAQSNEAAIYLMKNDLINGKKYLEKADKIYANYPELLNNWGLFFTWDGENDKARKKFEQCLEERPGFELCIQNMKLVK